MGSKFRTPVVLGLRAAFAVVMFSAIAPAPAEASLWCWLLGAGCGGNATNRESAAQREAPEIDPGGLASAIALAAGGAAMLSDRVRRRR
jgi:hypothetical protein